MNTQARKIGDIEITALSDGVLTTSFDVVLGVDKPDIERLSGKQATDPVPISVNAFLLKRGGELALIDTGSSNTMGPTLGKLPNSLRALGVTPESIGTIFLTHLHPDHSNGLVDDQDRAVFPNAEVILHETEAAFWLDRDDTSAANDRIRRSMAKAKSTTAPYRDRMRRVRNGEAMPGISAVQMPGHTPGHTGWLIEGGKDALLVWGDLVHLASIQIPLPATGLIYDVDPQMAGVTRARMFDRIAADRLQVAGAHMDFPGFGTLSRKGTDFRFEPAA